MNRSVRVTGVIGVIAVVLLAGDHPAMAAAVLTVVGLATLVLAVSRRLEGTPPRVAPLAIPGRIVRILVPVDFSPESARAIDFARVLAGHFRSQVFVLYVVPSPRWPPGRWSAEESREARWRARVAMQAFLRDMGGTAGLQVVFATGTPFAAIVEEARRLRVELIVLGARGAGGAEASALGRTAAEVVRRASVPVLTVAGRLVAAARLDDLAGAAAA